MTRTSRFVFAPGLTLEVSGPRGDVGHLDREYAPVRQPCPAADRPASLRVAFGTPPHADGSARITGGHKTVRWTAALSPADGPATSLGIALGGIPRGFARSLVQGYFVEPMLSVVAAEAGLLLLPSAGIVSSAGLQVLVGTSRSGKSTLAARSLAAGHHVIGDDQVLVDADGVWRAYPRRLRFYPDLRYAAPAAWDALPVATRTRLRIRGFVAALTRAHVRPSLPVEPAQLGGRWDPTPQRATRIVLLERSVAVEEVVVTVGDVAQAQAWAATVLGEQRARLRAVADAAWHGRLDAADAREREILGAAIGTLPVTIVRIPAGWPAPRAVAAVERRLGLAAG